jgi:hypothetical protein
MSHLRQGRPPAGLSRRQLLQRGALGAAALGVLPAQAAPRVQLHVLLVILGGVGAHRAGARTPALDALGARGTRYPRAITADPARDPGLTSLLTGQPSPVHGVLLDGLPILPDAADVGQWLQAQAGVQPVWAGGAPLPGRPLPPVWQVLCAGGDDGATVASARGFFQQAPPDRPWLLGVHLEGARAISALRRSHGAGSALELGLSERELPPLPADHAPPPLPAAFADLRPALQATPRGWQQDAWMAARLIEGVDAALGALLAALAASAHASRTVVVVTADHGDALGSWQRFGPGLPVPAALEVPLLLAGPGVAAGVAPMGVPASTLDVLPTLCGLYGAPIPDGLPGADLRALALPGAEAREAVFADVLVEGQVAVGPARAAFQWGADRGAALALSPGAPWAAAAGDEPLLDLLERRIGGLRRSALHRAGLSAAREARAALSPR